MGWGLHHYGGWERGSSGEGGEWIKEGGPTALWVNGELRLYFMRTESGSFTNGRMTMVRGRCDT